MDSSLKELVEYVNLLNYTYIGEECVLPKKIYNKKTGGIYHLLFLYFQYRKEDEYKLVFFDVNFYIYDGVRIKTLNDKVYNNKEQKIIDLFYLINTDTNIEIIEQ